MREPLSSTVSDSLSAVVARGPLLDRGGKHWLFAADHAFAARAAGGRSRAAEGGIRLSWGKLGSYALALHDRSRASRVRRKCAALFHIKHPLELVSDLIH